MANVKSVVRKYVRATANRGLEAFFMGVNDGRAGKEQKFPTPPDNEKARLVALWALEMYKDGYEYGRRKRESGSA